MGLLPFSVYRTMLPGVGVVRVTVIEPEKEPPSGETRGVATVGTYSAYRRTR